MVKNRILSRRWEGQLPREGEDLKINGGPLYPADEVIELLHTHGSDAIIPSTRKCREDLQKWSLDSDDVRELIREALRVGRFLGSEKCCLGAHNNWAACDAYSVSRMEPVKNVQMEMQIDYYLKFAIGQTGMVLLLVSCHPPEDRR